VISYTQVRTCLSQALESGSYARLTLASNYFLDVWFAVGQSRFTVLDETNHLAAADETFAECLTSLTLIPRALQLDHEDKRLSAESAQSMVRDWLYPILLAIVGPVSALIATYVTNRSADRRHRKELESAERRSKMELRG
jgi:hypothetical protein